MLLARTTRRVSTELFEPDTTRAAARRQHLFGQLTIELSLILRLADTFDTRIVVSGARCPGAHDAVLPGIVVRPLIVEHNNTGLLQRTECRERIAHDRVVQSVLTWLT